MSMTCTVEQVSRVLNRLNMSFTTASAKRLVDNELKKVARPNNRYNTSFNYLVDVKSLEDYLINECSLDANAVYEAVYGGL